MYFATGQMTPPPRAAAAEYYPLTPGAEAGGVLAAGGRPSPLVEGAAAGPGSAAHCGAERRRCHVPGPRRSYAADGGPTVGAALVCSLSHPALHADSRGFCRRRNSWWKCRWTLSRGCGSSSRSLTFQHFVVPMEPVVFEVFSQDRAIPLLRSRSLTIQFHVVVSMKVFLVFPQD